jgi:hypothetical protein
MYNTLYFLGIDVISRCKKPFEYLQFGTYHESMHNTVVNRHVTDLYFTLEAPKIMSRNT